MSRALALATLVAAIAACGTSSGGRALSADAGSQGATDDASLDEGGGVETGAGTEGGSADAARDGSGACNALANLGAQVPGVLVASAAPAPNGGTLVDGTYVLTKYQVYTGPGGPSGSAGNSFASTLVLAGSTYQAVSNQGSGDERVSGAFMTSGTSYTASVTCPASSVTTVGYTFDGTTFVQLGSVGANTLEFTYAKQ
jgi:hypothetical protein